jgi:hypothetical protein
MKLAMLGAFGLMLVVATSARAENWFLMAPYENVMDNPMAVHQLAPEAANSPVMLVSHATFASHGECASARVKMMQQWRERGSLSAQQFRQYGGPSFLFRCAAESDPHLVKSPGGSATMTLTGFCY